MNQENEIKDELQAELLNENFFVVKCDDPNDILKENNSEYGFFILADNAPNTAIFQQQYSTNKKFNFTLDNIFEQHTMQLDDNKSYENFSVVFQKFDGQKSQSLKKQITAAFVESCELEECKKYLLNIKIKKIAKTISTNYDSIDTQHINCIHFTENLIDSLDSDIFSDELVCQAAVQIGTALDFLFLQTSLPSNQDNQLSSELYNARKKLVNNLILLRFSEEKKVDAKIFNPFIAAIPLKIFFDITNPNDFIDENSAYQKFLRFKIKLDNEVSTNIFVENFGEILIALYRENNNDNENWFTYSRKSILTYFDITANQITKIKYNPLADIAFAAVLYQYANNNLTELDLGYIKKCAPETFIKLLQELEIDIGTLDLFQDSFENFINEKFKSGKNGLNSNTVFNAIEEKLAEQATDRGLSYYFISNLPNRLEYISPSLMRKFLRMLLFNVTTIKKNSFQQSIQLIRNNKNFDINMLAEILMDENQVNPYFFKRSIELLVANGNEEFGETIYQCIEEKLQTTENTKFMGYYFTQFPVRLQTLSVNVLERFVAILLDEDKIDRNGFNRCIKEISTREDFFNFVKTALGLIFDSIFSEDIILVNTAPPTFSQRQKLLIDAMTKHLQQKQVNSANVLFISELEILNKELQSLSNIQYVSDVFELCYKRLPDAAEAAQEVINKSCAVAIQQNKKYAHLLKINGRLGEAYNNICSWSKLEADQLSKLQSQNNEPGLYVYLDNETNELRVFVVYRKDDYNDKRDETFVIDKSRMQPKDILSLKKKITDNSQGKIFSSSKNSKILQACGFVTNYVYFNDGCYLYLNENKKVCAYIRYKFNKESEILCLSDLVLNYATTVQHKVTYDLYNMLSNMQENAKQPVLLEEDLWKLIDNHRVVTKNYFSQTFSMYSSTSSLHRPKIYKAELQGRSEKSSLLDVFLKNIQEIKNSLIKRHRLTFLGNDCKRNVSYRCNFFREEFNKIQIEANQWLTLLNANSITSSLSTKQYLDTGIFYYKDYLGSNNESFWRMIKIKQQEETYTMTNITVTTMLEQAEKDLEKLNPGFFRRIFNSDAADVRLWTELQELIKEKQEMQIFRKYLRSYARIMDIKNHLEGRSQYAQHAILTETFDLIDNKAITVNGYQYTLAKHDKQYSYCENNCYTFAVMPTTKAEIKLAIIYVTLNKNTTDPVLTYKFKSPFVSSVEENQIKGTELAQLLDGCEISNNNDLINHLNGDKYDAFLRILDNHHNRGKEYFPLFGKEYKTYNGNPYRNSETPMEGVFRIVKELANDMKEMKNDIQEMKKDSNEMKNDIQEMKKDSNEMKTDIQEMKKDSQGVKKRLDNLEKDMPGVKEDKMEDNKQTTKPTINTANSSANSHGIFASGSGAKPNGKVQDNAEPELADTFESLAV